MSISVEYMSKRVASRVDSNLVGIDPLTIMTLVTTVLLPLISCFTQNDEPDPDQVAAAVKERFERNPRGLRRRTARKISQVSARDGKKLTGEQAGILADAVIQEAMSTPPATVAAFVAAHS